MLLLCCEYVFYVFFNFNGYFRGCGFKLWCFVLMFCNKLCMFFSGWLNLIDVGMVFVGRIGFIGCLFVVRKCVMIWFFLLFVMFSVSVVLFVIMFMVMKVVF